MLSLLTYHKHACIFWVYAHLKLDSTLIIQLRSKQIASLRSAAKNKGRSDELQQQQAWHESYIKGKKGRPGRIKKVSRIILCMCQLERQNRRGWITQGLLQAVWLIQKSLSSICAVAEGHDFLNNTNVMTPQAGHFKRCGNPATFLRQNGHFRQRFLWKHFFVMLIWIFTADWFGPLIFASPICITANARLTT